MEEKIKEAVKEETMRQLEILATQGVKSTFALLYAYIAATETQIDDAIMPFLQMAEKAILGQVSKIDGDPN